MNQPSPRPSRQERGNRPNRKDANPLPSTNLGASAFGEGSDAADASELPPSHVSRWVLQMSAESPVRPRATAVSKWRKPTGWALLALGVGAASFVASRTNAVRRWLGG